MKSPVKDPSASPLCAVHRAALRRAGKFAVRAAATVRTVRLLAFGLGLSVAGSVSAQNSRLDVKSGSTDLTVGATYTQGTTPTTTSDITFSGTYSPLAFTAASALSIGTLNDLDGTQTLSISGAGLITLNGGTNTVAPNSADLLYVITGGTLNISNAIALTTTAANGNFDIAGSSTLSGVISGTGFGFTKTGTGTLTIAQGNTLSGAININAGTLANSGGGATITAFGTAAVNLNNGGTLQLNSSASSNPITIGNALTVSGTSSINLNGNSGNTSSGNPIYTFTSLTLSSGAALSLTSVNYSSLGATTTTLNGSASITDQLLSSSRGGFFALSAVTVGNGAATGTVSTLTLNNTNPFSSITGIISDNSTDATKQLALVKNGTGTTAFTNAANTYSGGTTVNLGTLTVGTSTLGAATGTLSVNNTNTGAGLNTVLNLKTNGATTTGSLSGAIATPSSGTNTATINNGGQLFTVNQTTAGTYAGVIAGTGGFALGTSSTNTLTLTGTETYTGTTTVNAGTLQLGNGGTTGRLATGSAITVNSGGTFAVNRSNTVLQGTDFSTAAITGAGGFTQAGAGTTTLSLANTYTGATTVNGGTLNLTGSLTSAITVNSGGTLAGAGNGTTTGFTTGNLTVNGGGVVSLTVAAATPLTIGGATTLGSAGTYGAGTFGRLNFTLGGSNVVESLNTTGSLTANNVFVSITNPTQTGTFTLANYGSLAAGNFSLSSTTGNVLTQNVGRNTETLTVNPTTLVLSITGAATPGVAFFNGAVSSVWNDLSNANLVNFSTNLAGTADAGNIVGVTSDVILNAANAPANRTSSETLGASTTINSLNVNGNGTTTLAADGSTLTINALGDSNTSSGGSYTGNTAGVGIAISSGANAFTVNVPLLLGNTQSWTNNSASLFSVGGAVSGTATTGNTQTLTLANAGTGGTTVTGVIGDGSGLGKLALLINNTGGGVTFLSGANTFTGGTTINAGTVQLGSATALGAATNAALTFGAGSTGRLQLNGNSVTLTGLSTNATVGTPIIESSSATAGTDTLTVNSASANTYAGVLQDGGTRLLALTKSGAGSLTLSGANTYSGGTNLNTGTLNYNNASAVGTGTFAIAGGTTLGNTSGAAITSSTNNALNIIGDFTYGGTNDLNLGTGTVALNGGRTITVSANTLTIGGTVTSTAVLTKAGAGTLALTGTGNQVQQLSTNGGIVDIGAGGVSLAGNGGGNALGGQGGTINATGGGTIKLNAGGGGTNGSDFGLTAAGTLTINAVIANGTDTDIDFYGSNAGGTLVLAAANTFTGFSNLQQGTVRLANSLALANSTVTYFGFANAAGSPSALTAGTALTFDSSVPSNAFTVGGLATNATTAFSPGFNIVLQNNAATPAAIALSVGNNNLNNTYVGTLSGAGSLTKIGTGTQTLTGANSYTGTTTVNAGALIINGAQTGTGAVNVTGGTLLGGGAAPGSLSVASGANLAPGKTASAGGTTAATAGVLSVGALTLAATSNFNILLNENNDTAGAGAGTIYSQLAASSVTSFSGANLNLTLGSSLTAGDKFFILLNSSNGTLADTFNGYANGSTFTSGATAFTINYFDTGDGTAGNDISLTVTAVPEPATWLAGALSVGALGYRLRRRLTGLFKRQSVA